MPVPHMTVELVRLNYIQWSDTFVTEKPYEVISDVPDGCKKRNFNLSPGPEQAIHDIRGLEHQFSLDENGFEVRKHAMKNTSATKDDIERYYLPDIKSLLENVDPGAEVHIFDWRLRSSDKTRTTREPGSTINLDDPTLILEPVQAVHNDQSRLAAIKRVKHHLGDRADKMLARRFRIINVWRPLRYPIENFPLALCDGTSVSNEQLLAVDHVRKNYVGESLYPLYSSDMQWYFLDRQEKDEVLIFKTFDSSTKTSSRCCPHTSFRQSAARAEHIPRETIEVRALVFSQADEE
ncbi:hypothetical protein B0T10DRAFT_499784 [Thelonectria olida]|uniref:Methyltransferase n=1 Tax=Thelonectria olida TaxID=1576542 RepID=A0A9P8VSH0_9HYPO|nr:hypothetical protein B0T10DRAFT_499784 [Thelonectria olida]